MKRKVNKITFLISLFVSVLLASCTVDWNQDLFGNLNDDAYVKISYAADSGGTGASFVERYLKGTTLKNKDLPTSEEERVKLLKPGYNLAGWTFDSFAEGSITNPDVFTVNNIRTKDVDFDGSIISVVESISLTNEDFSLVGHWIARTDTPYTIKYFLENLECTDYDLDSTETAYGTTDTLIDLLNFPVPFFTGFEPSPIIESDPSNGNINGDGSTVVTVKYNRESYEIRFYKDSGNWTNGYSNQFVSWQGNYQQPTGQTEWPNLTKPNYKFYGWAKSNDEIIADTYESAMNTIETKIPATFTDNLDYHPVWGPEVYLLTFKDQFGKALSGTVDGELTHLWQASDGFYEIPSPSPAPSGLTFQGWYTDEECSIAAVLPVSSLDSDTTFYAKWKYKKIYVDPENGSDENKGQSVEDALKTIQEAVRYAPEKIMLCSALTDPDDIYYLNGFDIIGIKIGRYSESTSEITFPFIHIKPGVILPEEKRLNNITLDGGADWSDAAAVSRPDNGAINFYLGLASNKGQVSGTALIVNEGTMFMGDGVILTNNCNIRTDGGAIWNSGTLTIQASTGNPVKILNNTTSGMGGGIYQQSPGELFVSNALIGDENRGNSGKQGGAIALNGNLMTTTSSATIEDSNISYNRSETSGGGIYAVGGGTVATRQNVTVKATTISNNVSTNKNNKQGSGGGVYVKWGDFSASDNTQIVSNTVGDSGGGITYAQAASGSLTDTLIKFNKSTSNGGGISCTGGSNGMVSLNEGTIVMSNEAATGSGIYLTNSKVEYNGGYVTVDNVMYVDLSVATITLSKEYNLGSTNNGKVTRIVPKEYVTNSVLIKNATGNSSYNMDAVFVIDKKVPDEIWGIIQKGTNGDGYLDNKTVSAGGGITNPLETTIDFAIAKNGTLVTATPELKISGELVSFDWSLVTGYNYEIKYFGSSTGIGTATNEDTQLDVSILVPGTYKAVVDGYYDGIYFYKEEDFTID